MALRAKRTLELLKLGAPLRRYAGGLQADRNAAYLLVHQTLTAALGEDPAARDAASLETSLRQDIDHRFAAMDRSHPDPAR